VRGSLEGRPEAPRACPPQRPHAPAPSGALIGLLPTPNHFRIFADKLRVICIVTSLPPPSGAVASEVKGEKRGSGDHNGSRSPKSAARAREHSGRRHAREALFPVSRGSADRTLDRRGVHQAKSCQPNMPLWYSPGWKSELRDSSTRPTASEWP
jgi:hypothetical protein